MTFDCLRAWIPLKMINQLFRWRWYFGITLFGLLVLFKVHGVSLASWNDIIKDTTDDYRYLTVGVDRGIRSDEYAVSLPLVMAQCNHPDFFPRVNDRCNGTGMDMFICTPPCPVWNWTVIGQAGNWGYFLFGVERGMSWNWFLRYLIGFLFAFEFFLIWLDDDRPLALTAALAVTLGAPTQWWTTTVPYLNLFFFASLVFMKNLFIWRRTGWKLCAAFGLLVSISSFVFSNYPPFQLIYGMILILLSIEMVRVFNPMSRSRRLSFALLGFVFLLVFALCVYFAVVHAETIQRILNSSYPGKRVETGGSFRVFLSFQGWKLLSLFTPIRTSSFWNQCFVSVYFVPLIAFWGIVLKCRRKLFQVSFVFVPLLVLGGLTLVWMVLSWPLLVARGTLFYIVPPRRMAVVSSLLFLVLIFKLFKFCEQKNKVVKWLEIGGVCLLTVSFFIVSFLSDRRLLGYFVDTNWIRGVSMFLIAVSLLLVISIGLLRVNRRFFLGGYLAVSLLSGVYVHPLSIGVSPLKDKQLAEKVRSIEKKYGSGLWGCNTFTSAQFLIANGFRCLNGIQQVGNPSLWRTIDPEDEYQSIWNRYSHVLLNTRGDSEPTFELLRGDVFEAYCNKSDLDALGIDYLIWSGSKLREPWFEYLGRVRRHFIYKVSDESALSCDK